MTRFLKPKKIKAEVYVGGLSSWEYLKNPIKLSANESALGPSPKAIQAFTNSQDNLFRYPADNDSEDLRSKIEDKFNIDRNRVICGAGSDQIIDLICKVLLDKGDEVIVTQFGFIMYRIYASLHKAKIVFAREENFKASVSSILRKVTKKN